MHYHVIKGEKPKATSREQIETLTLQLQKANFGESRTVSAFRKKVRDTDGLKYVGANLGQLRGNGKELMQICEWLKKPEGFLYVYGIPGKGKTHFCSACFMSAVEKFGADFRYFSEENFFTKLTNTFNTNINTDSELRSMLDTQMVIFDDLGSCGLGGETEWRPKQIEAMVDILYTSEIPAIFTSNFNQKEITEMYGARMASRLFSKENCLLISAASWPNYRG